MFFEEIIITDGFGRYGGGYGMGYVGYVGYRGNGGYGYGIIEVLIS